MNDSPNNLCIDLCSGLGGFSRAFVDAGWEVITVDIESKFAPTICADVCDIAEHRDYYPDFWKHKPDLILASPPCQRFSQAAHVWPLPGIGKSLRIVGACLEIIIAMKPKYWALENPANGKLRWFIGQPGTRIRINAFGYKTIKPTSIWGNIPLGLIPDSPRRNDRRNAFAHYFSKNRMKRAEMPYGLSKAILEAVEST